MPIGVTVAEIYVTEHIQTYTHQLQHNVRQNAFAFVDNKVLIRPNSDGCS